MKNEQWDESKVRARENELKSMYQRYQNFHGFWVITPQPFGELKKNPEKIRSFFNSPEYDRQKGDKNRKMIIKAFLNATHDPYYVHIAKIFDFMDRAPMIKETYQKTADREIISNSSIAQSSVIYSLTAKSLAKIEKKGKKEINKAERQEHIKLKKLRELKNIYIYNTSKLYSIIERFLNEQNLKVSINEDFDAFFAKKYIEEIVQRNQFKAVELLNNSGLFDEVSQKAVQKFKL